MWFAKVDKSDILNQVQSCTWVESQAEEPAVWLRNKDIFGAGHNGISMSPGSGSCNLHADSSASAGSHLSDLLDTHKTEKEKLESQKLSNIDQEIDFVKKEQYG